MATAHLPQDERMVDAEKRRAAAQEEMKELRGRVKSLVLESHKIQPPAVPLREEGNRLTNSEDHSISSTNTS